MSTFGRFSALYFFFFNDTATTEIYTLSLHDALPICFSGSLANALSSRASSSRSIRGSADGAGRSEEHTSELQSHVNLVCRLLLEKKKNKYTEMRAYYKEKTYCRFTRDDTAVCRSLVM